MANHVNDEIIKYKSRKTLVFCFAFKARSMIKRNKSEYFILLFFLKISRFCYFLVNSPAICQNKIIKKHTIYWNGLRIVSCPLSATIIDRDNKPHYALDKYPTILHSVTEMCTCANGVLLDMGPVALWDLLKQILILIAYIYCHLNINCIGLVPYRNRNITFTKSNFGT